MTQGNSDWARLIEFMFSGEAGSFAIWAILVYGVWATFFTDWRRNGGDSGWWDGDDGGD